MKVFVGFIARPCFLVGSSDLIFALSCFSKVYLLYAIDINYYVEHGDEIYIVDDVKPFYMIPYIVYIIYKLASLLPRSSISKSYRSGIFFYKDNVTKVKTVVVVFLNL